MTFNWNWNNWKREDYHPTPLIRVVQIVLLILIVVGIALLCTQKMWVPKLTDYIINKESQQTQAVTHAEISVGLGQNASALGVIITPFAVTEDSRCPVDVQCIQAGTVKVGAHLNNGVGNATYEFILGKPASSQAETITLVKIDPEKKSGYKIKDDEYVLHFEIEKF